MTTSCFYYCSSSEKQYVLNPLAATRLVAEILLMASDTVLKKSKENCRYTTK
jgi:hypothetical protein